MYIDGDTIIYWAKLIGAVAAIGGAAWAVVKIILRDKHQTEIIKGMQREQELICYGLRGALAGLIERGCNGPCKDALEKLNKHLNQAAHEQEV